MPGSISLDMFAVLSRRRGRAAAGVCQRNSENRPVGTGLCCAALRASARPSWRSSSLNGRFSEGLGLIMLWCVAGFGVFTILFGISRSLVLSMIALLLVGATGHGERHHPRDAGAVTTPG